jgi:ATP-dependent DNA helicase RecG
MPLSLDIPVSDQFRITPIQKDALKKLGIHTIEDLLYHFPARYGDTAEARSIDSLAKGDTAVIYGKITGLKASKGFHSRITMATATVEDESGRIQCVWFNQPYIAKMTPEGALVRIEGKVSERRAKKPVKEPVQADITERDGASIAQGEHALTRVGEERVPPQVSLPEVPAKLYFSNPKLEVVDKLPTGVGDSLFGNDAETHSLYPVYPESRGITSLWVYHSLQKIFKSGVLDTIEDPIPDDILEKYHLPSIKTAFIWMHNPLTRDDALSARKRFSFQEIFIIQLGRQRARREYEKHPSFTIETDLEHVQEFVRRFPFVATDAQNHAVETILADMKRGHAMSRLLEGDVGSGKTAVAAATAYAVMTSRPKPRKEPVQADTAQPRVPVRGRPAGRTDGGQSIAQSQQALTRVGRGRVPEGVSGAEEVVNQALRRGPLQVAYMCPTEILATQQFESFVKYFSYMPIQIGLITGSGCYKFPSKVNPKGWTDISRAQLLKWVEDGSISVLIGTHALIQKSVKFKNLAYAIIDEQHRFGIAQRRKLVRKDTIAPHLLSMTATPIPRTLALTLYGDLDLTLIDQSPAGRKPIITELVRPDKREETYAKIRSELEAGRQLYVICPRINEPDPDKEAAVIAKSVKEEAKRLKRSVFPQYEIDVLHSKMKPDEKDAVMNEFKAGKIQILCATSVVEVGVNVPNATVIIIEGAERFGLAQLHQLRGRVMRSSHQAYCYAFTETNSVKSIERLKALQHAKNGFELAELDLAQRGAGELSGMRQWGISDVAMEALKNLKMVEAARTEAVRLVSEDMNLAHYPLLKKVLEKHTTESHFE